MQGNYFLKEWNLHQRHVVARAVEAFQTLPEDGHLNNNNNSNVQANSDIVDAKISRDVVSACDWCINLLLGCDWFIYISRGIRLIFHTLFEFY